MPHVRCTLLRLSMFVCVALVALSSKVQGQKADPVITLAKPSKAPAQALVALPGTSPDMQVARENYREFSRATISQASEPETFTLEFHGATKLTGIAATADFHVTGGTCIEGHVYAAGAVCNVEVAFTPTGPGHRTGQLAIAHSASATPFLTPLGGTGYGPAISFTPSLIQTVPGTYAGSGSTAGGTLLNAQGLAVDGGDNLYIADTGNNLIKFRDSSGTISRFAGGGTSAASGYFGLSSGIKLNSPWGVAIDYAGTAYISDSGDSVVMSRYINGYMNDRVGGGTTGDLTCVYLSPCFDSYVHMTAPYSVALDPSGNLYTTLQFGSSGPGVFLTEAEVNTTNNFYLLSTTSYNLYSTSVSIAVDQYSNVYYTYEDSGNEGLSPTPLCYILGQNPAESTNTGGSRLWTIAGSGPCGFSGDGGKATGAELSTKIGQFAIDAANNLYFADTGNNRIRRVDAYNGVIRTVAGNGSKGFTGDGGPSTSAAIETPTGLAVTSTGQIYSTGIANATQTSGSGLKTEIRSFGAMGALNFGTLAVGLTAAAQTVLISNVGNDTLDFTRVAFTAGTVNDFSIDPNTTTCNFTAPLYSGRSCSVGILFTPKAAGPRAATLTLLDDTVDGADTIQVAGVGATTVTLTPASIAFPSTKVGSSSSAIVATLTNTGQGILTLNGAPSFLGTNATSFKQTTTCGTTLAVGASCTISVVFAPTVTGNLTATLAVKDNATTNQQLVSLTGAAVAAAAKPVLSPTAQAFTAQTVATTSTARAIKLTNAGNVAMSVSAFAVSGTNAADFAYTKNCGTTLAPGAFCTISVTFKPGAAGARSAALAVTTSAGKVAVALSGTGAAPAVVKSTVSLRTQVNPVAAGQAVVLTSRVASAAGVPGGRVQVREGGWVLAEAALANGAATVKLANLSAGVHTLQAVYLGDTAHRGSTSAALQQNVVRLVSTPHSMR